MTRRKDFETEHLRLTDIVLQHPQEYEAFFAEYHRRWMEQLKTREEWATKKSSARYRESRGEL